MGKQIWKPGNMIYPLPAVIVSCGDADGEKNILTIGWTGTICTNPPMVYISVRPQRHSYHLIKESGEFVINLTTKSLVRATDYCGVRSGKNENKFEKMNLTPIKASKVRTPLIKESPVNIECTVTNIVELGSHHMFLANVVAVHVEESLLDEKGKLELSKSNPIVYSHGEYYGLGELLGTFGYSVKKKKRPVKKRTRTRKRIRKEQEKE